MTQFDHGTIVATTKSGTALAADLNSRAAAENSTHAGSTRPAYATAGMIWVDTSFSPAHLMLYDGTSDTDLTLQFAEAPGTIKETARPLLETGWLWCDGSAVSRATYSDLFDAITVQTTGDTDETTVITGVADNLTDLGLIGAVVEGSGVPSGATVTAITATTITLSAATTATASDVSLRVLPHGDGNGSTTFDLPDRRDRVGAGRGDMGGSAASRLTSGGAGLDGKKLGKGGGSQTHTLSWGQMPVHGHTASSSGSTSNPGDHDHGNGDLETDNDTHSHGSVKKWKNKINVDVDAAENKDVWDDDQNDTTDSDTHKHDVTGRTGFNGGHTHSLSLSTTVNNAGSGQAHPNVQPTLISNYVIKT